MTPIFQFSDWKSTKRTTSSKPGKKHSKRPSSPYSLCYRVSSRKRWQHFPFLSLPQQITTDLQDSTHKQHVPENHFHRSALSRRLPQPDDSQLCTNMLGKGSTDFWLLLHCARPFILEYGSRGPIPTPSRWKPLQLPTLPAGRATTSNPDPQQKNTLMAASWNLYHWKGNDIRILSAASSIPYLPVDTGNYTIISSHSWTRIIMGVY